MRLEAKVVSGGVGDQWEIVDVERDGGEGQPLIVGRVYERVLVDLLLNSAMNTRDELALHAADPDLSMDEKIALAGEPPKHPRDMRQWRLTAESRARYEFADAMLRARMLPSPSETSASA